VGVSHQKVQACADDRKTLAVVDANWREARIKYNVYATPTFIIDGTSYVGDVSYDQLRKVGDSLLTKS
jgi:protein-disulfide isomerase